MRAIEERTQAPGAWSEEHTGLAAWVREDGARLYADGRAAREIQQSLSDATALLSEVKRLRSDPHAIESAARERLKMARANEIIVPIE